MESNTKAKSTNRDAIATIRPREAIIMHKEIIMAQALIKQQHHIGEKMVKTTEVRQQKQIARRVKQIASST